MARRFIMSVTEMYGNVREKMAKQLELEHFGSVAISHIGDNQDTASLAEHKVKV